MAVTLEYQAWAAGTYNWLDRTTSTSAPVQIDNKLRSWITAVNANPSNASKQVTIEKGLADGTGNYVGWNIKFASSSPNSTFYVPLFTINTIQLNIATHSGWASSTSNGGYGTYSGSSSGSVFGFVTGGANGAEFIVATETADTEEFFCLGYKSDSTVSNTNSGTVLLFKDTTGEWAFFGSANGSFTGNFYLSNHPTPKRQYGVGYLSPNANLTAGYLDPLIMTVGNTTFLPAAGNIATGLCTPKSPYIFTSQNTAAGFQFGRYVTLPGPRTAVCTGYSPIFVSYA